jgi:hypothetical protein
MLGRIAFRSSWIALLVCLSAESPAQRIPGTLRGQVSDSAGTPLRDAQVNINALGLTTRTDSSGRFSFNGIQPGTIELVVRRLGYERRVINFVVNNLGADSITVILVAQPSELPGVDVKALRDPYFQGFEERRKRGVGTFLTRAEIEARNPGAASDLFRRMPGVRFVRVGAGLGVRLRATGGGRRGGDCAPTIWLDGQRTQGMEIDDLRSGDIEAIEMYRGSATLPAEFNTASQVQCGAVIIWTKRRI